MRPLLALLCWGLLAGLGYTACTDNGTSYPVAPDLSGDAGSPDGGPPDAAVLTPSGLLTALTVTPGVLSPAFSPTTTLYSVPLLAWVNAVQLTVTAADPGSTFQLRGVCDSVDCTRRYASGATLAVPLTAEVTTLTVIVEAPAGLEQIYTVVLTRSAVPITYLKASDSSSGMLFGRSMALSGDTLVVGSLGARAVYVFQRSGATWVQQAAVRGTSSDPNDEFGSSVALFGDTLVIGAPQESSKATGIDGDATDNSLSSTGAAYVFQRTGTTWTQQAYLKASNTGVHNQFGTSVAIAGDTVVVGSPGEPSHATGVDGDQSDHSLPNSGAVYVFKRTGSKWAQQAYVKASNTDAADMFGSSVAIDGDTMAVGALYETSKATGINGDQTDNSVKDSGAVYVFQRTGATWAQQAYLKASDNAGYYLFGVSVSVAGNTVVAGSSGAVHSSGAVYVFERTGATWLQQARIYVSKDSLDAFGYSVALAGDSLAVGAFHESGGGKGVNNVLPMDADGSSGGSGAAYLFRRRGTSWTQQAIIKAPVHDFHDFFGWSVALSGNNLAVGSTQEDSSATGVNGDQTDNHAWDSGAAYVMSTPSM